MILAGIAAVVTQQPAAPLNGWVIFGLILSGLGGLSGVVAAFNMKGNIRKINAEAKNLEVEPHLLMSQTSMEMLDRAARDARESKQYANALAAHVIDLETELRRHGITPPPFRWPPIGLVSDDSA